MFRNYYFLPARSSVVDPDRIGSGFYGVPGSLSGSGFAIRIRIQEGKKIHKNMKILINFIF
jgi:hypothetical protein